MSSQSKRVWEAPAASALSLRATAGLGGTGGDHSLLHPPYGNPVTEPTVPMTDLGTQAVRLNQLSSESAPQAWEAPLATALSIRATAGLGGTGGDHSLLHPPYGNPVTEPTVPMTDVGARTVRSTQLSSESAPQTWEAPLATALSIRATAGLTGSGGDNFLRHDNFGRQFTPPTAPMTDVGALPIPSNHNITENSPRTWEAPLATALSIRATAGLTGSGGDNFMRHDNFGRQFTPPTAPMSDVGALPIPSNHNITENSPCTWEAPLATALSIRATAGLTGSGGDNFMRHDNFGRQFTPPTAPMTDVGALPIPSSQTTTETQRAWEAPTATTLSVRDTASLSGGGPDNFGRFDVSHRPGLSPTAPTIDVSAPPVPAKASAEASEPQGWETPVVKTIAL